MAYTTGSSSVKVAILDDGMHWLHPELVYATHQAIDYMGVPQQVDNAFNPWNDDTHGTSIAGIIAAAHDGAGSVGIAPGVELNIARILRRTYDPLQFAQSASDADIADAFAWAYSITSSAVISNSWGGGVPSNQVTNAINNAATLGRGGKGAVVVFAAGNTSNRGAGIYHDVSYPAGLANVITVGAIDRNGAPANYTPRGSALDVVAISGHNTGRCLGELVTIDLFGAHGCDDGPDGNVNYTTTFSGTSAAAPQVAGAVALLLTREPTLTRAQVQSRLATSSDSWGAANDFGAGKLNVVSLLFGPLNLSISGPTVVPPQTSQSWSAVVSGGLAPYTYQWKVDGSPVGAGSSLNYQVGSQGFDLSVEVGQAGGASKLASIHVSVSGCPPPQIVCE